MILVRPSKSSYIKHVIYRSNIPDPMVFYTHVGEPVEVLEKEVKKWKDTYSKAKSKEYIGVLFFGDLDVDVTKIDAYSCDFVA